ncbi:hypothetical protein SFC65_24400 [Priestia filamentosa]|uniref:hypothetical protein n=1 Tax=Priestia filamentosa TaxID=1402861 RepID=UPI0039829523
METPIELRIALENINSIAYNAPLLKLMDVWKQLYQLYLKKQEYLKNLSILEREEGANFAKGFSSAHREWSDDISSLNANFRERIIKEIGLEKPLEKDRLGVYQIFDQYGSDKINLEKFIDKLKEITREYGV